MHVSLSRNMQRTQNDTNMFNVRNALYAVERT